jgi:hypothetical protein
MIRTRAPRHQWYRRRDLRLNYTRTKGQYSSRGLILHWPRLPELGCYEKSAAIRITRTYRVNTHCRGIISYTSAEVVLEKAIVRCTMCIKKVDGLVGEDLCFQITVDCETSMVRISQSNLTHDSERNVLSSLSEQSMFPDWRLPTSLPTEATTMPARARVTKERNRTIVSG